MDYSSVSKKYFTKCKMPSSSLKRWCLLEEKRGEEGDITFFESWCFMFYDGPTIKTKIIIKCEFFMLCKWRTLELLDGLNYKSKGEQRKEKELGRALWLVALQK